MNARLIAVITVIVSVLVGSRRLIVSINLMKS